MTESTSIPVKAGVLVFLAARLAITDSFVIQATSQQIFKLLPPSVENHVLTTFGRFKVLLSGSSFCTFGGVLYKTKTRSNSLIATLFCHSPFLLRSRTMFELFSSGLLFIHIRRLRCICNHLPPLQNIFINISKTKIEYIFI